MSPEGDFGGQFNQFIRHGHSCLKLAVLIKMSTNNPGQRSVVLDSSIKLSLDRLGLTKDSRATDSGGKLPQSGRG